MVFLKSKINLSSIFFLFLCISGCMAMESDLVRDMDDVYQGYHGILSDAKEKERDEKISLVAKKYFPIGMDAQDAIKYLEKSEFDIYEYTSYGVRKFPSIQITPYGNDVSFKRSAIGSLIGDKRIYAKKQIYLNFWYFFKSPLEYFMAKKEVVVVLDFSEEKILDVEANVWVTGV